MPASDRCRQGEQHTHIPFNTFLHNICMYFHLTCLLRVPTAECQRTIHISAREINKNTVVDEQRRRMSLVQSKNTVAAATAIRPCHTSIQLGQILKCRTAAAAAMVVIVSRGKAGQAWPFELAIVFHFAAHFTFGIRLFSSSHTDAQRTSDRWMNVELRISGRVWPEQRRCLDWRHAVTVHWLQNNN